MRGWNLAAALFLFSCPLFSAASPELFYPDVSLDFPGNRNGQDPGWYDATKIVEVDGEITHIEIWTPVGHSFPVYTFFLSSIQVYLGPVWYVDAQKVPFHIGDRAYIVGSKLHYRDQTFIVAAQVEINDPKNPKSRLSLRTPMGVPYYQSEGFHPRHLVP